MSEPTADSGTGDRGADDNAERTVEGPADGHTVSGPTVSRYPSDDGQPVYRARSPVLILRNWHGVRVDELWAAAYAIADGRMPPARQPALPKPIQEAVLALAQEIRAARVPLVAIGPEGFTPPESNYIGPGPVEFHPPTPQTATAGRPAEAVLREGGRWHKAMWFAAGTAAGTWAMYACGHWPEIVAWVAALWDW